MKLYAGYFSGCYLGGKVIVQARGPKTALKLINARIAKAGFDDIQKLEDIEEVIVTYDGVIHFENGDY